MWKNTRKKRRRRLVKQHLPSVSTGRPQLLGTNIRHAVAGWWWQFNPNFGVRRLGTQPAKPHAWFLPLFTPRRMTDQSYCCRLPSQPFRGMYMECLRNLEKERPAIRSSQILRNKKLVYACALFFDSTYDTINSCK